MMHSEPVGAHSTAGPRTGRLRRLSGDVLYNLGSLGFLVVAGLMLNLVIGHIYGAGILGIFSVVFAIYIFASQIGTAGIHYSVLRSVSLASVLEQARAAAYSSLLLVALTSTLATLAAWLCRVGNRLSTGLAGPLEIHHPSAATRQTEAR
jgi:O-antigen/teichoic acid export membrane protein